MYLITLKYTHTHTHWVGPTFTDTVIPYISNHPTHRKYAAVRFLFNRLNSYNLQHEEYQQKLNTIHNILPNNSFPIKPHKPHTLKPTHQKNSTTPTKWARFTYIGKETSYITNIFRRTDLKIPLRTKNIIGNLLRLKNPTQDLYAMSGAYKLTCPDCNKAYVGQTGGRFSTRYKEHKTAFRNNNQTYSFAKHLNDTSHSFGPMNDIMQILHCHKKRTNLNTIERFHIHTESIANNQLNDDHTIFPSAIFDVLSRTNRP
jgi:transposase-like protein